MTASIPPSEHEHAQKAARPGAVLSDEEAAAIDAYWRATLYLTVGQIYLRSNPLLRTDLSASDIKSRLLGHWGTCPGLNLVYVHMNRCARVSIACAHPLIL